MKPRRAAGRAAAAALLAVLALGALLWWALRPAPVHETPARLPAAATRASGVSIEVRLPESPVAGASAAPTAASPAASWPALEGTTGTAAGTATPVADAPVWDLCGVGRLPVPRGATARIDPEQALAALPPHLGRDALIDAYRALFAALDAGPPRWRAAAVMLRGSDAAGRPQALALPEMARSTDDPVVAMWAQQRCDLGASCLEMAERWAQVEPQNMAPWVTLLARQPQRRDELMARMAAATRFNRHAQALSLAMLEAMPAGVAPYVQPTLWVEAIGTEAAMSMPSFNAVFDHCRDPLAPGSDALRTCTAVARTLVERSDGLTGVRLGLRLAERSYLSRAEAAARRKAVDMLLVPSDDLFDRQQPLSCADVARTRAWVEQRARLGELGALRARAAQRAPSAASGSR
ncbi:MAG: hypothetical protein Q7U73_11085 [Rubrivivax sp.]|nr:hypothetical protein [Rubrivivax sp.]